ncbi:MAG TPA: hypothetical protein PKI61_03915 [bacterium]|nr:hypothetical protein [bacterium]HPT29773.1 hypothetical protein [bacterium]
MKTIVMFLAVMIISLTAAAQYNNTSSPEEKRLTVLKKELKLIEKLISDTEKKQDKEIKQLSSYERAELLNSTDEDEKDDISLTYKAKKDSANKKYETELSDLKKQRGKKLEQLTNSSITSSPSSQTAVTAPVVVPTTYSGIIDNPLWVDVNITVVSDKGDETKYYLAKNSTLKVSLPVGNYTAWRTGTNNYRIGEKIYFKVAADKKHIYKGCEVAFYVVATAN